MRIAEAHAANRGRVAQVKTLAGVIRTTGLAIIGAIVGLQFLDAVGVNLAPLLAYRKELPFLTDVKRDLSALFD